ncbi:MAG: coproporphyrinogen III oxidase, partial [Cyclobacteriaceae bacterium]|nr:coproporphyrinogen III oxidase [Cyclobacteriaceae bacterium]
PYEIEYLTKKDLANEFLLTSLRTKWGCDLQKLKDLYSYDLINSQKNKLSELIKNGFIIMENESIFLSRSGKFLADSIISDLFWV